MFILTSSQQAAAQTVVYQATFEDGTTTGWYPFGSPTISASSTAAHGGTYSLLTTGRTQGYYAPAHDLAISTFAPGSTFQFSAWVRVTDAVAGNGDKATMTIKRTDASCSGGACYDTVGTYQAAVTNTWLQLSGSYTVPAGATALTLYFQVSNSNTPATYDDFFLDDVTITSATIPPPTGCAAQDNSGISTDFEDGTLQGWMARGSGSTTAVNVNTTFHLGQNSMYVSGRTANWNGAQIAVDNKMCVGSQYSVSAWVKLDPADGANHVINISVQTTYNSSTNYTSVTGYPGVTVAADGNWHEVKVASFSMGAQYDTNQAFLYLQTVPPSGTDAISFYVDDFKLTYLPPLVIEPNIASVYQHFTDYFAIGAAVGPADMSGAHSQLLAKHFNSITSGNDMKWDATEPTENSFRFTNADAQVAFAQAHNMQVRGHTLLWHSQVPAWVFQKPGTSTPLDPLSQTDVDLLKARLQNHIHNVMSHFGNKVYAWDVVNEVIDESQGDCLRRSNWYNIIGPSYIDLAFQYARAESSTAKLFINDYNSTIPNKRTCLYNLVDGMIQRGVPVDGVGHQMHNNLWFPPVQQLIDAVNLFHGLTTVKGVPLDQQITEFDESIYPYPPQNVYLDYSLIPTDTFIQQGYVYRDYFEAMKQLNSNPNDKKISSVTIWGMSDDETWLTNGSKVDAPLLFDTKLQHKYAYTGIMDPLSLPGADLAITASADLGTVMSGNPVVYTITVTNNGHDPASNVVVTGVLSGNLAIQSGSSPAGWTCTTPPVGSSGTVTCSTASMANGASAQFSLTAIPTAESATQVVTSVSVASDTRDPNPDASNNAASVSVNVTPVASTPTADSASPIGGSGNATFTFKFSNPTGYAGLTWVQVIVNNNSGYAGGCAFMYYPGNRVIRAMNDAGNAWSTPATVGVSGTVGNSQCTINAAAGAVSGIGNQLALTLPISFAPSFVGQKNIYGIAANATSKSVWRKLGTWGTPTFVPVPTKPSVDSVSPNDLTGPQQNLTFQYSSVNGYTFIDWVQGIINSSADYPNSCAFYYIRPSNELYLISDDGLSWQGPATVSAAGVSSGIRPMGMGAPGVLSNNQCSIDATASTFSGSGNSLTLTLAVTEKASVTGYQFIYGYAMDHAGLGSGWAQVGKWLPNQPVVTTPPTVVSATSVPGTTTLVFNSGNGGGAISWIQEIIGPAFSYGNSCSVYLKGGKSLYLMNDAGTTWLGPVTLGQAGTVANTQCSINAATSTATVSGNDLTLNLSVTYAPGFAGLRNAWGYAVDNVGRKSGWVNLGPFTAQ